jgi:MFS family permease
MGTAMQGMGFGAMIGPPLGGALYALGSDSWPAPLQKHSLVFLFVTAVTVVQMIVQLCSGVGKSARDNDNDRMLLGNGDRTLSPAQLSSSSVKTRAGNLKSLKGGMAVNYGGVDDTDDDNDDADADHRSKKTAEVGMCAPLLSLRLWLTCLPVMCGNAVFGIVDVLLPVYLGRRFDLTAFQIGLTLLPVTVPYLILVPFVGRYAPRWGRIKVTLAGSVVTAVAVVSFTWPSSLYGEVASISGIGVGVALVDAVFGSLLARIVDDEFPNAGYGLPFAMSSMAVAAGYLTGTALGSYLDDVIGFVDTTYAFAGFVGFTCFLLWPLRKYDVVSDEEEADTAAMNKNDGIAAVDDESGDATQLGATSKC